MKPEISILMPVYNSESSIIDATKSVLSQTFENFELIIVDDGSTDKTLERLSRLNDRRIIVLKGNHNYIASLNYGLDHTRGKYIARMDADDYMHSDRLRVQWLFMEKHRNIDVCGTWVQTFGQSYELHPYYSGYLKNIFTKMLHGNPIFHPTVMMRKESFKDLHYENYEKSEDYKLWFEAAKRGLSFYIMPLVLHYYFHSIRHSKPAHNYAQKLSSYKIKEEILEYIITLQKNLFIKNCLIALLKLYQNRLLTIEQTCIMFTNILTNKHNGQNFSSYISNNRP